MISHKRLPLVILLPVFVGSGFLLGMFAHHLIGNGGTPGTSLSDERILKYCRTLDSRHGDWELRELQRSVEFQHVRDHLKEWVSKGELISKAESISLSTMVWRAAFLFGTRQDIAVAFKNCQPKAPELIATDLATSDARTLTYWLICKGADQKSIQVFLIGLADQDPRKFGVTDYTPLLVDLMRHGPEEATRLQSAYCLARWKGGTKLCEEALKVLRNAKDRWLANLLLDDIRSLGTHGWDNENNDGDNDK